MSERAKVGILGIGGVFFRAKDPKALSAWYAEKLDLAIEGWGGVVLHARDDVPTATTVWYPFRADTEYFGRADQQFMLNYRVRDLDAALAELERRGVAILPKREDTEDGRFAWIVDCEDNRIELWQPPPGR